ncbi:Zinc finger, RING-type [Corchorus olitorius]|uniref:Zinc finger, RING-type n=1 Tax=Corchorus olitorius TaxID=93759 RepID=A0A1R3IDY4_9ROSI|nr:Zinc finger, RING-type [Corchorus olitorius]
MPDYQEILQLKSVRLFVWNMSLPHPQPDGDGQFLFFIKSRFLRSSPASNIEGFSHPISYHVPFGLESLSSKNDSGHCGGDMDEVAMFDGCNYEAADEESIDLSLRYLLGVPVFSLLKPIDDSEPLGLTQVPRLDSFQQFEYSAAAGDPDEPTSCAICLEGFSGNSGFKLPCSHVFHGDCVAQWLWRKRSCPLCRFQLS